MIYVTLMNCVALLLTFIISVVVCWSVYYYIKMRINLKRYGHIPHIYGIISWMPLYVRVLRQLFNIKLCKIEHENSRFVFEKLFKENNTTVAALIFGDDVFVAVNSPELMKHIGLQKKKFPKNIKNYSILTQFGDNIVTNVGEKWKQHRHICNPSFGEKNNQAVAKTTTALCNDMFKSWQTSSSSSSSSSSSGEKVISIQNSMISLTLGVIADSGFGQSIDPFNLKGKMKPTDGRSLSFKESFEGIFEYMLPRLVLPKWSYYLPFAFVQKVKLCFEEFEAYLRDIIDRKGVVDIETNDMENDKADLLSLLIAGNQKAENAISKQEVIANCFLFFFAGHETTASALTFALGCLSVYQDIQQKLYEECKAVLGERTVPTYDDFPQLIYARHVFYETLRKYGAVAAVPKISQCDSILDGYFIPKHTTILLHLHCLHYNDKVHKNPHDFNPERFNDSNMDKYSWLPFAVGARSCIGRKFAEVEGVLALTQIIMNYKVDLPNDVKASELLETQIKVTLQPKHEMKLKITPRNKY